MNRISWAVTAALALSAYQAHAEHPGVIFSQKMVPTIKVTTSNKANYDQIVGQSYPLTTQLSGYCPTGVYNATVKAAGIPGDVENVDVSDLRNGDKRMSLRLQLVPYSLTPIEWPAKWKAAVLDACNRNLVQQMNARHWQPQQVFARDWNLGEVTIDQMTAVLGCDDGPHHGTSFDSSGPPSYDMDAPARVKLICGKHQITDFAAPAKPKTGPDDLTYGVHVVQANLAILPKTGGNGPCGVTLSGVIETDAINTTVTFFYRNNKGGTTPWRSVKTDHSKTAFFADFIDFGKPSAGGFTLPTPGPSGAPGGTFAATPSTKDFNGTYQIVGKNIAFQSNVGHFAFDCTKATPGHFNSAAPKPHAILPAPKKKS